MPLMRLREGERGVNCVRLASCHVMPYAVCGGAQAIVEAASLNQDGKKRKIVVTGCLAQRYGETLAGELQEADLVVGFQVGGLNRHLAAPPRPCFPDLAGRDAEADAHSLIGSLRRCPLSAACVRALQNYGDLASTLRGTMGLSPQIDASEYAARSRVQVRWARTCADDHACRTRPHAGPTMPHARQAAWSCGQRAACCPHAGTLPLAQPSYGPPPTLPTHPLMHARTHTCMQVGDATVPFRPEWDRFRLTPQHTAYLRVAEGCNHACTFCAIPGFRCGARRSLVRAVPRRPAQTEGADTRCLDPSCKPRVQPGQHPCAHAHLYRRGKFRSKAWTSVLEEARHLVASGVKELNLIAEDTNQYGMDR